MKRFSPKQTRQYEGLYGDQFDQGYRYRTFRPEGRDDYLLILTTGGGGLIKNARSDRVVGPGDLLLYQPGAFQDYSTHPKFGSWQLTWVHFYPKADWMALLDWPQVAEKTCIIHLSDPSLRRQIQTSIVDAGHLVRSGASYSLLLAQNILENVLIRVTQLVQPDYRWRDPRIEKAMRLLSDATHEPRSVEELARGASLSPSRFAHLFRDQVGISPGRFAELARLQRAAGLLKMTPLSISQIASDCGYPDPFYFSNRFKKHFGTSPKSYRRRAAAQANS